MRRGSSILIGAAALLGACGSDGDDVVVDASPEAVARAAAQTSGGTSGRVEGELVLHTDFALLDDAELSFHGVYDGEGRVEVTMQLGSLLDAAVDAGELTAEAAEEPVRYVFDGTTGYACWDAFAELLGGGASCFSFDPGAAAGPAPTSNPAALLAALAGAADVEPVGRDEVDGVPADHLQGTFTLGQALDTLPPEQAEELEQQLQLGDPAEAAATEVLDEPIPFDVWIDDDGYARRARYSIEVRPPGGLVDSVAVEADLRFSDFGADIVIDVPDPSDVSPVPLFALAGADGG